MSSACTLVGAGVVEVGDEHLDLLLLYMLHHYHVRQLHGTIHLPVKLAFLRSVVITGYQRPYEQQRDDDLDTHTMLIADC